MPIEHVGRVMIGMKVLGRRKRIWLDASEIWLPSRVENVAGCRAYVASLLNVTLIGMLW